MWLVYQCCNYTTFNPLHITTTIHVYSERVRTTNYLKWLIHAHLFDWSCTPSHSSCLLLLLLLLPLPKERGYDFTQICSSVCPLDYSKSYEQILMNFIFEEWVWTKEQSVASEWNRHCGGEVWRKRPKLEAQRAKPGCPHQLGDLEEHCKLPQPPRGLQRLPEFPVWIVFWQLLRGQKDTFTPQFQHCGGKWPRCPHSSDAFGNHLDFWWQSRS